MKLDEIFDAWNVDSDIGVDLGNSSLKIAKLHYKYYRILSNERLVLHKLRTDFDILKLQKEDYYKLGPTKENTPKDDDGWKVDNRLTRKPIKETLNKLIATDEDIIELSLKIDYQQEKVTFLEDIIKMVHSRGYQIKNAIDYIKFKEGIT